jgi:hypothetical protein
MTESEELKKRLREQIIHSDLAKLRLENAQAADTKDLSNDIVSYVRHLLFLYRIGRLHGLNASPKRFLLSALFQYTVLQDEGDNTAKYATWRKDLLAAMNQIDRSDFGNLRDPIPREHFVWYWQALDLRVGIRKTILNYKGPTEQDLLLAPEEEIKAYTYDEYLRDLSARLHFKSEFYDIILLDCNSISEYRNKATIECFEEVLNQGRFQDDIPQHFRIGKTTNGSLDALPVTRNFHLPAAHQTFFSDAGREEDALRNIVRSFMGANDELNKHGRAVYLQDIESRRAVYKHYWGREHEYALQPLIEIFSADNNLPVVSSSNAFSGLLSSAESGQPEHSDLGILCPFSLGADAYCNMIPMQLARGAHATYTFMAYSANAFHYAGDLRQSFLSTRLPRGVVKKLDAKPTIYMCPTSALAARMKRVLNLIFNFVPDAALCLDHQLSALVRDLESVRDRWFDPCLPIEAVGFQQAFKEIEALRHPARFNDEEYLNCFGGFCFGVSATTQDPVYAASVARDLAKELSANSHSIEEPYEQLVAWRQRLKPNDIAMPVSDFYKAKVFKEDTPRDVVVSVETPTRGAVRPNFELWPHIESEIADTFRLYVAALFLYRAIHMEMSATKFIEGKSEEFETALSIRATAKSAPKDVQADRSLKLKARWYLGVDAASSSHQTAEHAAIDVTTSKDVRLYLGNLGKLMRRMVQTQRSEDENRADLEAVIDDNISPLLADSDYLLGILRDCADQTAQRKLSRLAEDGAGKDGKRIDHFLPVRNAMLDALATSLARTITDKVRSHCRNHGWDVLPPAPSGGEQK